MTNISDAIESEKVEQPEIESVLEEDTATEPETAEQPKSMSLDDALAAAVAKHVPDAADKPKAALPSTPPAPAVAPGKTVDPITGRTLDPINAPAGMSPTLREKWGGLDRQMQQYWVDRERDMSTKLNQTAEERKLAAQVKDTFGPYEAKLREFNMTGVQLAGQLMNQWYALQTGDGVRRAEIMVGLLNHFKPDPQAIQRILAGQPLTDAPRPQEQPDVSKLVQAEIDRRESAAKEREAQIAVDKFSADPQFEFLPDVREQMSKMLNAGIVDGDNVPDMLKKAYDLACYQHPEISQVLAARRAAAAPAVARTPVKPVGSVKQSLGNGKESKTARRNMSLDDAVNEAWSRHVK